MSPGARFRFARLREPSLLPDHLFFLSFSFSRRGTCTTPIEGTRRRSCACHSIRTGPRLPRALWTTRPGSFVSVRFFPRSDGSSMSYLPACLNQNQQQQCCGAIEYTAPKAAAIAVSQRPACSLSRSATVDLRPVFRRKIRAKIRRYRRDILETINPRPNPLALAPLPARLICESSTGNRQSAFGPDQIRVFDVESGECLHTLLGHTAEIVSLNFDTNGQRVMTGSFDHTVKCKLVCGGAGVRDCL